MTLEYVDSIYLPQILTVNAHKIVVSEPRTAGYDAE